MMKFIKISEGNYRVQHNNEVFCGNLLMGDDGYYAWWPPYPGRAGYWSYGDLLELWLKLEELNKAWDEQVQQDRRISNLGKGM